MSMNSERHTQAFVDMFNYIWSRQPEKAATIAHFYESSGNSAKAAEWQSKLKALK